jgi:hypothetical protein
MEGIEKPSNFLFVFVNETKIGYYQTKYFGKDTSKLSVPKNDRIVV